MAAYPSIIGENTTIVLSTSSDLFKYLKGMTPKTGMTPKKGMTPKMGMTPKTE
jgi:membrane protease subunit HflC